MSTICPTVLASNAHQFREQIEHVAAFATNIHLDFTDGEFTDSETIGLSQVWWPHTMQADLHIMYQNPAEYLDAIVPLNPRLVIVHAEADGSFTEIAERLHQAGIKVGVALLPETSVETIRPSIKLVDHVLIFSGDLGHFGGRADLGLLKKVEQVRHLKNNLEIGWDGGVNDKNIGKLTDAGVNILNVGGFIQRAEDPKAAYQSLQKIIDQ